MTAACPDFRPYNKRIALINIDNLYFPETPPPALYTPESYTSGQLLSARLRSAGSDGLAYDSVRANGRQCAAVFWPRLL